MASTDEQLAIIIKAQDEASQTLKDISSNLEKLTTSGQNTTTSMGGLNTVMGALKTSAGVLLGMAGFAGISQALQTMKGFLDETISLAQKYDDSLGRMVLGLHDHGQATQANITALQNFNAELSKHTTFSEMDSMAVEGLGARYGLNVQQLMQLVKVTQDATISRNSLSQAEDTALPLTEALMRSITTGMARGLTDYGLKLDKVQQATFMASDETYRFNTLIDKLAKSTGGDATTAAASLEGQFKILNNEMDIMKVKIGNVAEALEVDLFNAFTDNGKNIDAVGTALAQMVKDGGQGLLSLAGIAVNVAKVFADLADTISQTVNIGSGPHFDPSKPMNDPANDPSKVLAGVKKPDHPILDAISADIAAAQKKFAAIDPAKIGAFAAAAYTAGGAGTPGSQDITQNPDTAGAAAAKKAKEQYDAAVKSVQDFKLKVIDMVASSKKQIADYNDSVKDLAETHKQKLDDIATRLKNITDSYNDAKQAAKDAFDTANQSADKTLQSGLVAAAKSAQDQITARQNQIDGLTATGGDPTQIANLKALNARDQAILDQHNADILAAQKKADDDKTALGVQALYDQAQAEKDAAQKRLDDQNAKNKEQYDQQSAALDTELARENASYTKSFNDLVAKNKDALTKIKDNYLDLFTALTDQAKSLLAIIAAPNTNSAAALASLAKSGIKLPGKASGGPVSSGQAYLVGEKGPEVFTPGISGTIIPNHNMGGTQNVTININVDNTNDLNAVKEVIDQYLGSKLVSARAGVS